jgi:hypothetical protein
MTDLGDTLASDAAQEIVKALVAGLVEVVKKVPGLWRRRGEGKEELIRAEVERSSLALQEAGDNLPAAQARQEGVWEGRLRDLLVEDPDAVTQVRALLEEIRHQVSHAPRAVQNITASAPDASAQGAMFGNVINYGDAPRSAVSKAPPGTGSADEEWDGRS